MNWIEIDHVNLRALPLNVEVITKDIYGVKRITSFIKDEVFGVRREDDDGQRFLVKDLQYYAVIGERKGRPFNSGVDDKDFYRFYMKVSKLYENYFLGRKIFKYWSCAKFGNICGFSAGAISLFLNGKRPIPARLSQFIKLFECVDKDNQLKFILDSINE